MTNVINCFIGENRVFSNFHLKPVLYNGIIFPSNEHAYQYYKGIGTMPLDSDHMRRFYESVEMVVRNTKVTFSVYTPAQAKRYGKKEYMRLRPDWETVQPNGKPLYENIMYDLVLIKFTDGPEKELLLKTGDANLIEGNWWHDNRWGKCFWSDRYRTGICLKCQKIDGLNLLGRILMQVRTVLNANTF